MFNETAGPATMDDLLGKKVAEATIMESKLFPKGDYVLELVGVNQESYEIKNEGHPFEGEEAARLEFNYIIKGVDDKGKYFDVKDKRVSADKMAEFVDQEYTESVLFGNDGLVVEGSGENRVLRLPENDEDKAKAKNTGFDKAVTLMQRHLGEQAWEENDCDNKSLSELIELATGKLTITPIGHNKWGDRVNVQINIMDEFQPVG